MIVRVSWGHNDGLFFFQLFGLSNVLIYGIAYMQASWYIVDSKLFSNFDVNIDIPDKVANYCQVRTASVVIEN